MSAVTFAPSGSLRIRTCPEHHLKRVAHHQATEGVSPMPQMSFTASVPMIEPIVAHRMPRDTALGAWGHHARRRGFAGTGPVVDAPSVGRIGPEDRHLAAEAVDRAPHVGFSGEDGRVVDEVARGEVVGAVEDEVVLREQLDSVLVAERELMGVHSDQRIDLEHRVARRLRLRDADVGLPVDHLSLQIGLVDDVEVDDADRPDAPAVARVHISVGEPSPPAPMTRTWRSSRFCPAIPTSGMIRWQLYRATSSRVSSAAGSTSGGSVMGRATDSGRQVNAGWRSYRGPVP